MFANEERGCKGGRVEGWKGARDGRRVELWEGEKCKTGLGPEIIKRPTIIIIYPGNG